MGLKIALAGNPNSGKTTLFNALTGSNQFVGNWPGVTVEKKEGRLKGNKDVLVADLPGVYSLSPYTLEEVVTRDYLIEEKPDVILNIIDGTNLERNLYFTTQLLDLNIPIVLAINMCDVLEKSGTKLDEKKLSEDLGVPAIKISALKGTGIDEVINESLKAAKSRDRVYTHRFDEHIEHALADIANYALVHSEEKYKRWYAIKLFERDVKVHEKLGISSDMILSVDNEVRVCEDAFDDDAESIITNERYIFVESIVKDIITKSQSLDNTSSKIDKIVTNRILALPIFAIIMFVIYYIVVSTVGGAATDWANDQLLGDDGWNLFGIEGIFIPGLHAAVGSALESLGVATWLIGLINDGIVAGVGAVLGFVPQILLLFIFLAFLESCGYMSRVAFIMDSIFRKFGLSGKAFIPIMIGTGCGVPGIMASRTIESQRDRRMTIMTTTFIPCSAKLPIIAMIAGAIFDNSAWVAFSAYVIGICAILFSGLALKKTKRFSGDPSPFVMELPPYHMPTVGGVLRSMWERGWSFIKKAGTIILLSTIVLWFLMNFGFSGGGFTMLDFEGLSGKELEEMQANAVLAKLGSLLAPIFSPLGFGNWQFSVAAITGLIAKENVVATFGMLYGFAEVGEAGDEFWGALASAVPAVAAYAYLVFNLLCAPCFAAMGAIRREMNNVGWFWFAIGYQCGLAWAVALIIYQIGGLIFGVVSFNLWTIIAIGFIVGMLYMIFRKQPDYEDGKGASVIQSH